jgi:PAS domain S-box-containing protein
MPARRQKIVPGADRADMTTLLRVLLIEDSEDDAALIARELRRGGYELTCTRVDTATGLTKALTGGGWDLITCDWEMPQFSGSVALEMVRAHDVDVAVIVVSGEVGEEFAVTAMKEGADDLVSKNRLTRLVPAVEHGLRAGEERRARRRAEEALRQSEEHFRTLTENTSDLVAVLHLDGMIAYASPSHERLLGYRSEELVGHNTFALVHPDDLAVATAVAGYAAEHPGVAQSFEWRARHKDGSWRHVESIVKALNQPQGLLGIINSRDITDRKRAEMALRESEERHRSLFDDASDMIYTCDLEGHYTWMNAAGERLTGYSRAELLGMDITQLVLPSSLTLEEGYTPGRYSMNILTKDGREVSVEVAAQLVLRDGQPVGWQGVARDVTQHKRFEAELKRAKDAAEAATRAKSDFLARMSHEIRTPMNGVIGMLDLLDDTALTGEQREYLEAARGSGALLLSVINDILDFSKIEAGKLDIEPVDFDVRQCLTGALRALAALAQDKGLQLTWHVAPEVPDHLRGDPGRLQQILVNLVANAIKFTNRGEVTVNVDMADGALWNADLDGVGKSAIRDSESTSALHFSVRDHGTGIPRDKQAAVFEAFEQADGSTTRQYGGTGLGLAICKRLVEMMEGRIWVESEPGHGSTFHFTARLATAAQAPDTARAEPTAAPLRSLHILVAEDNIVNQKVVVRMLEKRGHVVLVVNNGKDAVTTVQRYPFDVVLMDVQMPEMDGFEATAEIRRREREEQLKIASHQSPVTDHSSLVTDHSSHIPIIAMTAHAMKGDRERCLAVGMDGYVSKPIIPAELFAALAAVTTVTSGELATAGC